MRSEDKSTIQPLVDAAKRLGCPEMGCPSCKAAAGCFRRHDSRQRQVLVLVEGFVLTCVIVLIRWKCSSCHLTFTHYPEFLIPYKRYVLSTVLAMSERYVSEPAASYREVVAPQGEAVGYAEGQDGGIDERQLSHTTLWYWLSWLGGLGTLADRAANLLRQKDPGFELHRAVAPIEPTKYRSTKRRDTLEQTASLLRTGAQFMRHFSRRIFPTLSNSPRINTG